MPKKFEIMYLPAEGPAAAHGQWYSGVLGQQGWSVRLSQRKISLKPIRPDSTVGQILSAVYPGMPLTNEQPTFYILTREVAGPKRVAKPKKAAAAMGAAGEAIGAAAGNNNVNMNMGNGGTGASSAAAGAANNNANIAAITGQMSGVSFAAAAQQQGVAAVAQEANLEVDSQEDLADYLASVLGRKNNNEGAQGGKRRNKKTQSKRRSTTRRRRYSKRS